MLAVVRAARAVYRATVVAGVNHERRRYGQPELDRRGRRQLAGLTCFVLLVGGCAVSVADTPQVSSGHDHLLTDDGQIAIDRTDTRPGDIVDVTAEAPAAPVEQLPDGERVTVARVIDGDTFELADGRQVRVLGIDSCETDTYGGKQAKLAAEGQLQNQFNEPITITVEPGAPDTDRSDRLLRYVQLAGYDFGESMVRYDHTGVYQGENDASTEYVQRLYAADLAHAKNPPAGRDCGDPAPAGAPAPAPAAEPEPAPAPASNCHPSYTPCIPDGPDLDCSDISHPVRVVGPDEYRLDRDKDGRGCEAS